MPSHPSHSVPPFSFSKVSMLAALAGGSGKFRAIRPKSIKAVLDKYNPFVFLDMWTICRVMTPPYSIRKSTDPIKSNESLVMPMIRCVVGIRYVIGHPISSNKSTPAVLV